MNKNLPKKIHFMGIGGSGNSAVALMAKQFGFEVSGCDVEKETAYLGKVKEKILEVYFGHDSSHIKNADIIVVSPAILYSNKEHPEVKEALSSGRLVTWEQFVGKYLQKGKTGIAIAGTHGKSTTTALAGLLFEKAGKDPSVIVGAKVKEWNGNFRVGASDLFIIEADEFNDNYLFYKSEVAIVNNIEFDHPDYFKSERDVLKSFEKFVLGLQGKRTLIVNLDSPGINELSVNMGQFWKTLNVYGYTLHKNPKLKTENCLYAEILEKNKDKTVFKAFSTRLNLNEEFVLTIPGEHNVQNALGIILLGLIFKVNINIIKKTLSSFSGIGRRLELIGEVEGVKIYDDYAHHPTAIKQTLKALRQMYPKNRIWTIVEPHSFSRTKALLNGYKDIFSPADNVIITTIYKARDMEEFGVSGQSIVDVSKHSNIQYIDSFGKIIALLNKEIKNEDVIIVMGAGKSYLLARDILKNLEQNSRNK